MHACHLRAVLNTSHETAWAWDKKENKSLRFVSVSFGLASACGNTVEVDISGQDTLDHVGKHAVILGNGGKLGV